MVELEIDRPARPDTHANAEESSRIGMDRSTSEQAVPALEPTPDATGPVEREGAASTDAAAGEEPTGRVVVRAVAAEQAPRRRVTGRVPDAARSPRPTRTREELLAEARQLTESWSVQELTADRIRKAVRTSADKGRWLRETLRAERGAVA
ncbi:hypothetical protein ACE14D_00790 [Streptomyces sp. Act-28]